LAFRYLLLATHYRQKLNFTFEGLEGATTAVQRLNDFVLKLKEAKGEEDDAKVHDAIDKAREQFEKSLDDDLEMSPALAALFDLMTTINKRLDAEKLSNKDAQKVLEFMNTVNTVLDILAVEEELPPELKKLFDEREQARAVKNWSRTDEIRDELKEHGIAVEDTPHGQRWKRIFS